MANSLPTISCCLCNLINIHSFTEKKMVAKEHKMDLRFPKYFHTFTFDWLLKHRNSPKNAVCFFFPL